MIELAEMIAELRRELETARAAAQHEELHLELGTVEMEVTVAVGREAGASGKVRFWVVELGGSGKITDTTTQRIKLNLQPRLAGSAEPPWVSGAPVAGER